MAFNREGVRLVRERINAALAPLQASHQLICDAGSASYLDNTATFKLVVTDASAGVAPGQDEFNNYCRRYGLLPEDFGKEFVWKGQTMTLCGVKPKSRTYPLLGRNANDKTYKFPREIANLIRPGAVRTSLAGARRELGDWDEEGEGD